MNTRKTKLKYAFKVSGLRAWKDGLTVKRFGEYCGWSKFVVEESGVSFEHANYEMPPKYPSGRVELMTG